MPDCLWANCREKANATATAKATTEILSEAQNDEQMQMRGFFAVLRMTSEDLRVGEMI
jgi:hypothetical protein